MMYAIVAKVVIPARISRKKVEPAIASGWRVDQFGTEHIKGGCVLYMAATREVKEVSEARCGDIGVNIIQKIANTTETRATDFSFNDRAIIMGGHHAVRRRRGSHRQSDEGERASCVVFALAGEFWSTAEELKWQ
jgi:hypothetical protein